MSDEQEEKSGLKVNDRRRFDSSGNERGDTPQETVSVAPDSAESPTESSKDLLDDFEVDATGDESVVDFSSFVMSLATQAMMLLGAMEPPPGVNLKVDKNGAQQTIEILSMIEKKTKGNLDASEAHLIEEILHTLRMNFVRA